MPLAATLAAVLLTAAAAAPPARSAQAQAGRTIYREGTSATGGVITALVGGDATPLPGSAFPCAACHGPDGEGRAEGSVRPSVVTWRELARPGGHLHAGRRHRPFDAASLARAVTEGVDPDGQRLDAAMPRYSMSGRDLEALRAYLEVLDQELDPGLADGEVRLGTVLPVAGRLAGVGAAMRAALEAALAEANAGGGINGRRLALVVEGFDADREDGRAAAARLLSGPPVFALVSGFVPGAEAEVAGLAEAAGVPFVGPFTPFAGGEGHFTFHVLGGLTEQARVLVAWAGARPETARPRAAVLRASGAPFEAAATAALEAARALGWPAPRSEAMGADGPSAEQVTSLAEAGVEVVLLLGADAALAGLLERGAARAWRPLVLAPGTLAARAAAGAPAAFDGRVVLAYPSRPDDVAERARARLAGLGPPGQGARHQAAQVSAMSAFAVVAEGLRRAGRQLSRAGLVTALEGLSGLETGLVPPVSFGPRRRIGARGAYVVAVEREARSLRPLGGWVRLD